MNGVRKKSGGAVNGVISPLNELVSEIDRFIKRRGLVCWEAEYQKGEYCIGENDVRKFIIELLSR